MDVRALEDSRSDAELVAAAMAGDRGAFAAIYDRYADRLHDFCWSLLRDRDEAADATQDAFLVAAERLGQLRDPERLRPWLYAVARSQALRRARARQRVVPEEEMIDRPDTAAGPESATAPCSTSTCARGSRAPSWARPWGSRPATPTCCSAGCGTRSSDPSARCWSPGSAGGTARTWPSC